MCVRECCVEGEENTPASYTHLSLRYSGLQVECIYPSEPSLTLQYNTSSNKHPIIPTRAYLPATAPPHGKSNPFVNTTTSIAATLLDHHHSPRSNRMQLHAAPQRGQCGPRMMGLHTHPSIRHPPPLPPLSIAIARSIPPHLHHELLPLQLHILCAHLRLGRRRIPRSHQRPRLRWTRNAFLGAARNTPHLRPRDSKTTALPSAGSVPRV